MCKRDLPYEGIAPYQVVIGVATKVIRETCEDRGMKGGRRKEGRKGKEGGEEKEKASDFKLY
jgi:hypothetical protein